MRLLGKSEQLLIIQAAIHSCLTCVYTTTLPSLRYRFSAYLQTSAYGPVPGQLKNTRSFTIGLNIYSNF